MVKERGRTMVSFKRKKLKNDDDYKESKYRASMQSDLALMALIVEVMVMVVFDMFVDRNVLSNLGCTLIALFLMILTYFVGLIPALATNLIFLFIVVIGVAYEFVQKGLFFTGSIFWIVMPPLLCITLYFLTDRIRKLQAENAMLKEKVSEVSTLDSETNLRTVSIFRDHFEVFSTLAKDYDFPLYLYVFRVKYWNAVSGILSKKDQRRLIRIVSEILDEYKTGHEFVYNIDHMPPTWGMLSTMSMDGQRKIRDEVKDELANRIKDDKRLGSVDIQLEASKVKYNDKEHPTAALFLQDGIHELQYDVSVGSADNR